MPEFTTPGPIAATVEVAGAQVRVGASDRTDTVVLVEPVNKASLTNGNGGFDIDRAAGSVTATTGAGAIRIGHLTRGRAELVNGSGNIEIGISEGSAALVGANSERGTVRNSVPAQEDPGPFEKVTVHARTRHGDITIHRAGMPR
jgi:hypothetical protein